MKWRHGPTLVARADEFASCARLLAIEIEAGDVDPDDVEDALRDCGDVALVLDRLFAAAIDARNGRREDDDG